MAHFQGHFLMKFNILQTLAAVHRVKEILKEKNDYVGYFCDTKIILKSTKILFNSANRLVLKLAFNNEAAMDCHTL